MATVSIKKKFVADGVFKALLQVKRAPSPKGKKGRKKNDKIVLEEASTSDVRYNAKNSSNGTVEIDDEEQFPALAGNRNESNNQNWPENHRSKTYKEALLEITAGKGAENKLLKGLSTGMKVVCTKVY